MQAFSQFTEQRSPAIDGLCVNFAMSIFALKLRGNTNLRNAIATIFATFKSLIEVAVNGGIFLSVSHELTGVFL